MSIGKKMYISFIGVSFTLLLITGTILYLSISSSVESMVERELTTTANLITKIAQTSYDINQDRVDHNLKVAEFFFEGKSELNYGVQIRINAENQITHEKKLLSIPVVTVSGESISNNSRLIDSITERIGGAVTFFQIIDDGLIRISTSVKKDDGSRAIGTFIPKDSPVYKTVVKGETYKGRAFVVNDWYISSYKPVLSRGKIIGVLYVGIRQSDLNDLKEKILSIKIGETGYPYIIDSKGVLVIHPSMPGKDISKNSHIQEMIKNKNGKVIYAQTTAGEGFGKEKITYYRYVPEMEWIVAVGSYVDEFNSSLNQIRLIFIVSILAFFFVIMIVSLYLTKLIVRPLLNVVAVLKDISSGEGDLTKRISVNSEDEMSLLASSFNQFVDKIESVVAAAASSAKIIADATKELSTGNMDLSSRTENQAVRLEETSASIEELLASVSEVSTHAKFADEMMDRTKNIVNSAIEKIKITVVSMSEITDASSKISEIIKMIESIAFQTNILALNAAVEAARAGEHGRGFMVVASEVKKLASSTAISAKEITELISNNIKSIETGGKSVKEMENAFADASENVIKAAAMMKEINISTSEQKDGVGTIKQTIGEMDIITQQNASLVEEAASASEQLSMQTERLSSIMGFFKVREKHDFDYLEHK